MWVCLLLKNKMPTTHFSTPEQPPGDARRKVSDFLGSSTVAVAWTWLLVEICAFCWLIILFLLICHWALFGVILLLGEIQVSPWKDFDVYFENWKNLGHFLSPSLATKVSSPSQPSQLPAAPSKKGESPTI